MLISIFFGCSFLFLCSSEFAGKSSSKLKLRSLSPEDRCIADIQKQIKGRNLSKNLGGIVGVGWDSLTNEVTLPVFSQKYKLCRTVPDGDFLVPDNVMVLPIQEARISKSSEMHENFNSFKKSEGGSMTVSGGGGLPGIATVSGSLSVATKIGKEHMEKHKRTAFSNKIEYDAYTLIGTEKAGFDEVFQDRLNDILNAIKEGNPLLAQYEAESIIANYGTHVTNKAVAGARVTMLSFVESSEIKDKDSFSLKVAAEFNANIMGAANMGLKGSADFQKIETSGSISSFSQSYISTKGGPTINRLLSNNGEKMAIDSVVGLTREGMPLYSYIHPNVIKDSKWNNQMIYMVQDYLYNATQEYLRHNTIPGCTDSSATNYFHRANVAGTNVCKNYRIKVGWTMDGYFQKCEYVESYSDAHQNLTHGNQCEKYNHPHHLSKDYQCVDEDLTLGTIEFYVTYKHRVYNAKINGCNSSKCSKNFTITDRIKVTTTICNNFVSYNTRMFGGIFQNDDNVFAENKRCAQGYDEYPIFLDHKICLASISPGMDMSQYLKATSLGFLGFRSCNEDIKCPYEAAPYYLTTINNCAYYYCVNIIAVPSVSYYDTLHPSVNRPPFIDRHLAFEMTRRKYKHVINESKDKAAKKMLNEDGEEVGEIVN